MNHIDDAEISESVIVQTIEDGSPQKQSYPVSYYELGRYIGRHSFGYCYEARKYKAATGQGLGELAVVKMVKSDRSDEESKCIYHNEIKVLEALREVNSERLVKCHTHWKERNNFYIVLQESQIKTLREVIGELALNQKDILYFLREILKAVQVLHQNKIQHRNLKLESIVIDEQWKVKLTDFSLALLTGGQIPHLNFFGTPNYTAPQVAKDCKNYSEKSEVWSIGVILYYLIYSKFPTEQDQKAGRNSNSFTFEFLQQKHVSKEIIALVRQMLSLQESKRPSIDQLLSMKIFNTLSQKHKVGLNFIRLNDNWQNSKWTRKIDMKKVEEVPKEILDQLERNEKVIVINFIQLKKYGYFVLLSNLKLIAYFNNNHILEFQESMLAFPKSNEQQILLFVFAKYFKAVMIAKLKDIGERRYDEPQCTIKKVIDINGTIFLRLTNQAIQVFFPEGNRRTKDINDQYTSVSLNYNRKEAKMIRSTKKNESIEFASKEDIRSSRKNKYLVFVQNAFQEIFDNSIVSSIPQE